MTKFIEIVLPGFCIVFAVYCLITSKAAPGDPMDLEFVSFDGPKVELKAFRGKVVLLDFWATWCPPCRGEVPDVVAVYNRYHAQGFDVIGVSLDQDGNALRSFTSENGMVWPEYFDGNGWGNLLARRFSIRSIPQMWLLDQQGRVVTKDGRNNLEGQVAALLARPRLATSVDQAGVRSAP